MEIRPEEIHPAEVRLDEVRSVELRLAEVRSFVGHEFELGSVPAQVKTGTSGS